MIKLAQGVVPVVCSFRKAKMSDIATDGSAEDDTKAEWCGTCKRYYNNKKWLEHIETSRHQQNFFGRTRSSEQTKLPVHPFIEEELAMRHSRNSSAILEMEKQMPIRANAAAAAASSSFARQERRHTRTRKRYVARVWKNQIREASQSQKICAQCLQPLLQKRKKCSQCLSVYYCNQSCQKEHWPQHQLVCLPVGVVEEEHVPEESDWTLVAESSCDETEEGFLKVNDDDAFSETSHRSSHVA